MFPNIFGSLLGAGASLFGGLMGSSNASQQYWAGVKQNRRARQQNMKMFKISTRFARQQFARLQKKATFKYIMDSAKKAGIHPLYALGNAPQGSSVAVPVGQAGPGAAPPTGDGGLGSGIAQMGQHLGRAMDSMATQPQRDEARIHAALSLENAGLQNELLRSQIRRMNSQTGPALPGPGTKYLIDGQGNTVPQVSAESVKNLVELSQKYPDAKQNVQLGPIHQANPYVSNAQDVEDRHGEIADMLWGGISVPADVYWNYLRDKSGKKPWYHQLWDETFGTKPAY